MTQSQKIDQILILIRAELNSATRMHGEFNSPHEGYAVMKEELDELWDLVKRQKQHADRQIGYLYAGEAKQVAAMAIRFILDFGRI